MNHRALFRSGWIAAAVSVLLMSAPLALAQDQMPDPKMISGKALPDGNLPPGTISVRVIRGSFANNVSGADVEFTIGGTKKTVKTDADGRAQVTGVSAGSTVQAAVVLDDTRITSDSATVAATGLRFVLVGVDPDAAKREAEAQRLATGPAVKGIVVLGPETEVVAEFQDDRLNIFYVLDILNTARTPVDIGGPLTIDLPTGALSASLADGSSKQASVNGSRVVVTGPFAPGSTSMQVGFEMPYSGSTVEIAQRWPAALQQTTVVAGKFGDIGIESPQLGPTREVSNQGPVVLVATGAAIPAGGTLSFKITGLPHAATWPRDLALTLAAIIGAAGIWAAVFTGSSKPSRASA